MKARGMHEERGVDFQGEVKRGRRGVNKGKEDECEVKQQEGRRA